MQDLGSRDEKRCTLTKQKRQKEEDNFTIKNAKILKTIIYYIVNGVL